MLIGAAVGLVAAVVAAVIPTKGEDATDSGPGTPAAVPGPERALCGSPYARRTPASGPGLSGSAQEAAR
ncbi:hypothetical protein ACFU5Y_11805 [Streptomyces gardneri]|uniref:hypothetical protein n=1 Tax=Streptomyces gardneri TaxID=66892 RepID=UPI0036A5BB44